MEYIADFVTETDTTICMVETNACPCRAEKAEKARGKA